MPCGRPSSPTRAPPTSSSTTSSSTPTAPSASTSAGPQPPRSPAAGPVTAVGVPGDGPERLGEVGGAQPHGLGLEPVQEAPPGLAGHLGEDVGAGSPVGPIDLGRVVGDVAPEQGGRGTRADQQA